jgi:hypothetical protein
MCSKAKHKVNKKQLLFSQISMQSSSGLAVWGHSRTHHTGTVVRVTPKPCSQGAA